MSYPLVCFLEMMCIPNTLKVPDRLAYGKCAVDERYNVTKTFAIFAFFGTVFITGAARADIITFDGDASAYNTTLLTEGGLTFDTVSAGTCQCGYALRPGKNSYVQSAGDTTKVFMFSNGFNSGLNIYGAVGYSINLTSIDFGRGEYDTVGGIVTVNGGSTAKTFTLAATAPFTTEDLSAFGYVSNLTISYASGGGYLALDNIVYTIQPTAQQAVPEPSALPLFVSGLFAIGLIRRRYSSRH
jgi:hypothetical protein